MLRGTAEIRGPAQQGDIERAVFEGSSAIGLIDGHFQQAGAVWHKEILFALASGVTVYGSSSMGALRASECQAFGMIPVGDIAHRYCTGELFDDADVALTHAPAELSYAPLSEALVNSVATIERLSSDGLIDTAEMRALLLSTRHLFFADRTAQRIVEGARLGRRENDVLRIYESLYVNRKAEDAALLVKAMSCHRPSYITAKSWTFARSPFWRTRSSPMTPE
jgi:hypothetical protein